MLLHDPLSGKERRLEAWKALIEAKNQGKLRSIGVSNLYVSPILGLHHKLTCERTSAVKHLEEIKTAGLETPAVNQLEVRRLF